MKLLSKLAVITLFMVFQLVAAPPALAQTSAWSGVCLSATDPTVPTIQGLQCLLANILAVFLTIVGMAAFIMLMVASFRLLLSGGNTQETEKARKSVTYAIIGLIVAVSAFAILNLVSAFTGVTTILEFKIPTQVTN